MKCAWKKFRNFVFFCVFTINGKYCWFIVYINYYVIKACIIQWNVLRPIKYVINLIYTTVGPIGVYVNAYIPTTMNLVVPTGGKHYNTEIRNVTSIGPNTQTHFIEGRKKSLLGLSDDDHYLFYFKRIHYYYYTNYAFFCAGRTKSHRGPRVANSNNLS